MSILFISEISKSILKKLTNENLSVAINEIVSNKNKQFSPLVVEAFLEAVSKKEL